LHTFLAEKRELLVSMDVQRLSELEPTGEQLMLRLQSCQTRRSELLASAAHEDRPADSLKSLAKTLPSVQRAGMEKRVSEAAERAQLLQHQSFSNWVFVQRSVIHLARLLEIIATGGRTDATYGRGEHSRSGGSLVDRAA
jgi:hypothetical protein